MKKYGLILAIGDDPFPTTLAPVDELDTYPVVNCLSKSLFPEPDDGLARLSGHPKLMNRILELLKGLGLDKEYDIYNFGEQVKITAFGSIREEI